MRSKLPGYLLLSCLSFGFFTCIFHAVASAQAPLNASLLKPVTEQQLVPTPTIYMSHANPVVQKQGTQPRVQASPTPTVYQVPVKNSLAAMQTQTPTTTTVSVTPAPKPTVAVPSPTATPEPTTAPTQQPTIGTSTDLETLFGKYSGEYGVDKELLKKIAKCESGFNPTSNNSGMYLGMFQFSSSTWSANRNRMGLDPNPDLRTNPEEAIRTAAYVISRGGQGAWPVCSR